MATLETFLMEYVLKGADEVVKKNKEIEKTSDKVEEQEKLTEKATNNLNNTFNKLSQNGMSNLLKKTISIVTPMVLLGKAINTTLRFTQEADNLDFLSKKAGTTIENIQAISKASGATSQEVASVFENIQGELQGLRKGQESNLLKDMMVKYGISFYGENGLKSSQEIYESVAKKMSSLNTSSQIDLASMLGIDDKTTKLMIDGFDTYKKKTEEARKYNVFDKKYIENSKKFIETLKTIGNQLYYIAGTLARILIPIFNTFNSIVSKVLSLFVNYSGAVESMLIAIAVVLGGKMLMNTKTLITTFITLGKTIWSSMAPLLPFIAIVLGLFIIFQDIYSWIKGEKSIMGLMFGDFENVKEKVLKLFENLKSGIVKIFQDLKEIVLSIINTILHPIDSIKKGFKKLFKKDKKNKEEVDFKDRQETIDKYFNVGTDNINNSSTLNNSYSNKSANLQIDKIEINANNNATAISSSVSNSLEDTIININDAMI